MRRKRRGKTRKEFGTRSLMLMMLMILMMAVPGAVSAADMDESAIIPYQGYYEADADAYWDTMTSSKTSASGGTRADAKVEYVKINNIDVEWAHAKNMGEGQHGNGQGKSLSTYFPGATTDKEVYQDIVIKPNAGYHVTRVVVACTHWYPFSCETWELENAYDEDFYIEDNGVLTIKDVSSKFFAHVPNILETTNNYYVLIELEPINTPLYVEYDYGQFKTGVPVSGDSFETADGWIDDSGNNAYGTGEIQTNDTQFRYAYNADLTGDAAANAAAAWKHYANTVTPEAAADAAKAGYEFAGWKAEYYSTASASENSSGSYNNYNYTMSGSYGSGEYGEGDQVNLNSHVRLVAQWKELSQTSVRVTKEWNDGENQDGKRPESITFNLYADGQKAASKTVTAEDNWSWTFEQLDRYADGKEIEYTVEEEPVDGYDTEITGDADAGFTVINSYDPEKTSVSGIKKWEDADNQDGKRPESITVNLLADGNVIDSRTVTAQTQWTWSFNALDKYSEGKEIKYTVEEEMVDGYDTEITGNAEEGFTVTNTHEPEKISVSGRKVWDDENDQDGKRPERITINLLADGNVIKSTAVTEETQWTWTFSGLDKYSDGKEILYTFSENAEEDYSTVYDITHSEDGLTITNRYTPEKTSVTVSKAWNDDNDRDGLRPDEVEIILFADGESTGKTLVLSEENKWIGSFTDLPVYKDRGKEIKYTVAETEITGYETVITGNAENGYTVTNTYEPETVDINGIKIWKDADNQDGKRPESITINLLADGNVIDSRAVTAADKWTWSFTGLNKYSEGKEIKYTVEEETVDGYDSEITGDTENGYTVTNTHEPEKTSVRGTKTWDDADDQDGKRPESITVNLLADGSMIDSRTVTAQTQWTWSFENLDKFADGKEIVYTITEEAVENYSTIYSDDGTEITNSYTPEQTSVTVVKVWDDDNDRDGVRPGSAVVELIADNELTGKTVVLSEENNWQSSFTGLDVYKDKGKKIVYSIAEDTAEGYSAAIAGDQQNGYVVTNTHEPDLTSVTAVKHWEDADNQDGKRPESITVNLLANGSVIDSKVVTGKTQWTVTFENLFVNDNGKEIIYTVTEDPVEGYTAEINGMDITNVYEPETTEITINKMWAGDNVEDRPETITVNVYADGKLFETVELAADSGWTYTLTDLPKYREGKVGEEIKYSVAEEEVAGYTSHVDGYTITNILIPAVQTGDDSNTAMWAFMMMIAAAAGGAGVLFRRKRM